MKVYIYARYSTEHQTEASTADQLRRCREYAIAHGWVIEREYLDEGISGAAMGNRPGVLELKNSVRSGDIVLVVDTTRLSRSQDLAPLLTRWRHSGIRVIGVLDNFDSNSPTARLQAGLSGIMSEEFRATIAARTHSALQMRAKANRATGGRCFGYNKDGSINESEAAIVREIFTRVASGDSQRSIANDLNNRGVPSPGASWKRKNRNQTRAWLVSAIHAMLHNERYTGKVIWNQTTWPRDPDSGVRVCVERAESEWIVGSGPAIIENDLWEKVRAIATPRKFHGGSRGGSPKYLLSGVLVCGLCHSKLIATGKNAAWYYCGTHRQGGAAACSNSVGCRRQIAEELLLAPIQRDLLSDEAIAEAVGLMQRWQNEQPAATITTDEIRKIEEKIQRMEAQISAGLLERADVAPSLAAFERRRKELAAAARRQEVGRPAIDAKSAGAAYQAVVRRMREKLRGPVPQARAAIHEILGDVECQPDGRHLVAKIQPNPLPLFQEAGFAWIGSGGRI